MSDENEDRERDEDLSRWLQRSPAPQPSPGLRERVAVSYRRAKGGSSWRRLWAVRVSVPLPLLVLGLVSLAVAAGIGLREPRRGVPRAQGGSSRVVADGLAAVRPLPEIQMHVTRRER